MEKFIYILIISLFSLSSPSGKNNGDSAQSPFLQSNSKKRLVYLDIFKIHQENNQFTAFSEDYLIEAVVEDDKLQIKCLTLLSAEPKIGEREIKSKFKDVIESSFILNNHAPI